MRDNLHDDEKVVVFIDGDAVIARHSMTIAAALAAAGKMYTGRAVNGAPRFALCGMGVCQECRITLNGRQHRLACQVFCQPGMKISTGEVLGR